MKYTLFVFSLLLISFSFLSEEQRIYSKHSIKSLNFTKEIKGLDTNVVNKALIGFQKLKAAKKIKKDILTIVDFRLASTEKRMWILDLNKQKLISNNLVAHGKNSGAQFARDFSNKPQSLKSSLGFFVTGNTYVGKHGLSLYLYGQEKGINDNALKRAIVVHGAKYVHEDFIKQHGRLGRSWGCPAIPNDISDQIISKIKEGSCLFVFGPSEQYEKQSILLK